MVPLANTKPHIAINMASLQTLTTRDGTHSKLTSKVEESMDYVQSESFTRTSKLEIRYFQLEPTLIQNLKCT